jgi:hypothetical protein
VTISKSKRRHYYGTAYAPGVTTYGYRHRHLYGSSSSASIGVSKSESSPAPRHGSAAPALSANPAPQRAETLPMAQDSRAAPLPKATR